MAGLEGVEVKFRVWLVKDGRAILGKGGAELLKAILETGSIHAAAERLGYSYSFAWSYLRRIEERTGVKLIERKRGGQARGGANLTLEGKRLLDLYLKAEEVVSKALEGLGAI